MKAPAPLARLSICSFCSHRISQINHARPAVSRRPTLPGSARAWSIAPAFRSVASVSAASATSANASAPPSAEPYAHAIPSFRQLDSLIQSRIIHSTSLPSEAEVLAALAALREHALYRLAENAGRPAATAASAVLGIDEASSTALKPAPVRKLNAAPSPAKAGQFADLSELAFAILSQPNVFLTPKVLEAYLRLTIAIKDPAPIPAVFSLYAKKATPGASPESANPDSPKNAIPTHMAAAALDLAITSRDMATALDIIDTSVATPSFRRAKAIKKLVWPAAAITGAPIALYAVADRLAQFQSEVDHGLATKYAFAGLCAYAGFTVSIGMVALLSANDQMVRVTWVQGTPLRERWIREEERRALDLVAMAWGFEEKERRGFEEGEEWELLREVIERKGMVLDDPALMEGME